MTGPMPERIMTSSPKCNRPQSGDGIMSFPCTLHQGHETDTLDPTDPQPCYAVESGRTVRAWGAWSKREEARKQAVTQPATPTIECPICHKPAMKVTASGGVCEACGAEAEIQQDSAFQRVTVPVEQTESVHHDLEPFETGERDAEIIAAAQAVAAVKDEAIASGLPDAWFDSSPAPSPVPVEEYTGRPQSDFVRTDQIEHTTSAVTYPTDGCTEHGHEPATNPGCVMRPMAERMGLFGVDGHKQQILARPDIDNAKALGFTNAPGESDEALVRRAAASMGRLATQLFDEEGPKVIPELLAMAERVKDREGDQRLPDGDESIEDDQTLVIADVEQRRQVGIQRYKQGHRPFNGRNTLLDLYEENLDGLVYLRSLLRTREYDRDALIEVVRQVMLQQPDWVLKTPSEIAPLVVDRLLDWHIAQRTLPTAIDELKTGRDVL